MQSCARNSQTPAIDLGHLWLKPSEHILVCRPETVLAMFQWIQVHRLNQRCMVLHTSGCAAFNSLVCNFLLCLSSALQVAVDHKDDSMADFVKSQLLVEQVKSVKAAAERVSQLRRVGKGLGVFLFDRKV